MPETRVEILDSSFNLLTEIKSFIPLNKGGDILHYSKELSDFGQCTFRVSSYDPLFTDVGDIFDPHHYHVRVVRGSATVWQGAIIENPRRTKDFVEVVAVEYVWYLGKITLSRSSVDPSGAGKTAKPTTFSMSGSLATITFSSFPSSITPIANGTILLSGFNPAGINGTWPVTAVAGNTVTAQLDANYTETTMGTATFSNGIFRVFNSGTMADAVTDIMNEVITAWGGSNHALKSVAIGTIENPNYPPNMTDGSNPPKALSGGWTFGNGLSADSSGYIRPSLQFDFTSVLDVLKSFGAYTYADFNIDENLKFNFKKFLGNDSHTDVNFVFGKQGNAIDFNITRFGQRQANHLWGIATDPNGVILHADQTNEPSIATDGVLEEVMGFTDIKDQATLNARLAAELPLVETANSSANTIVLSEKAYPLGVYDVGDIVTVKVNNTAVQYTEIARIVGVSVSLHKTGRETTTVQTNKPLPWQYG